MRELGGRCVQVARLETLFQGEVLVDGIRSPWAGPTAHRRVLEVKVCVCVGVWGLARLSRDMRTARCRGGGRDCAARGIGVERGAVGHVCRVGRSRRMRVSASGGCGVRVLGLWKQGRRMFGTSRQAGGLACSGDSRRRPTLPVGSRGGGDDVSVSRPLGVAGGATRAQVLRAEAPPPPPPPPPGARSRAWCGARQSVAGVADRRDLDDGSGRDMRACVAWRSRRGRRARTRGRAVGRVGRRAGRRARDACETRARRVLIVPVGVRVCRCAWRARAIRSSKHTGDMEAARMAARMATLAATLADTLTTTLAATLAATSKAKGGGRGGGGDRGAAETR